MGQINSFEVHDVDGVLREQEKQVVHGLESVRQIYSGHEVDAWQRFGVESCGAGFTRAVSARGLAGVKPAPQLIAAKRNSGLSNQRKERQAYREAAETKVQ